MPLAVIFAIASYIRLSPSYIASQLYFDLQSKLYSPNGELEQGCKVNYIMRLTKTYGVGGKRKAESADKFVGACQPLKAHIDLSVWIATPTSRLAMTERGKLAEGTAPLFCNCKRAGLKKISHSKLV